MKPTSLAATWLPLFFYPTALALQVTPGSKCAGVCLDSPEGNNWSASASNTNSSDISCADSQYSTTRLGQKFQQCMTCLQRSTRVTEPETDQKWFSYNLRYTLDTCLFSTPNPPNPVVDSPCINNKSCQNLKLALLSDKLAPSPSSAWDYCSANDGSFMSSNQQTCIECLRNSTEQGYMANFIIALAAACKQQPVDGGRIGLSHTVFSKEPVTIIDPAELDKDPASGTYQPLPTPAIVGIAVGSVILLAIAVACAIFMCCREKITRDYSQENYYTGAPYSPRSPRHQNKALVAGLRPYQGDTVYNISHEHEKGRQEEWNELGSVVRPFDYTDTGSESKLSHISSITAHPAYDPRVTSRGRRSDMTQTPSHRGISPPAYTHQRKRSNTPDSFAEQAYIAAAEDSARLANSRTAQPLTPKLDPPPAKPLSPKKLISSKLRRGPSSKSQGAKGLQISSPILIPDVRSPTTLFPTQRALSPTPETTSHPQEQVHDRNSPMFGEAI